MKYVFLLFIMFGVGCASNSKKDTKKSNLIYSAICYSGKTKTHSFIEKLEVINVSETKGILVKTESSKPFYLKDSCVLERKNVVFKKYESNDPFFFRCQIDYVGDNVLVGQNYKLLKSFNKVYRVYNEEQKQELFINKTTCDGKLAKSDKQE